MGRPRRGDAAGRRLQARLGNVNGRGNRFFVEITGYETPESASNSGEGRVRDVSRLGELAPGKYVFHLTSKGQGVKVLHFRVP